MPYYPRRTSFFDEIAKGVSLGLSLQNAYQRAQQFELDKQLTQAKIDEFGRQRGVQSTLAGYANRYLNPTEMNAGSPEWYGEYGASNADFDVGTAPNVTRRPPTDAELAIGATLAGAPEVGQTIGSIARQQQPGGLGGSFTDRMIAQLATDPTTGRVNPTRFLELRKENQTTPESADNIVFGDLLRQEMDPNRVPAPDELKSPFERAYRRLNEARTQKAQDIAAAGERGRSGVRGTAQYQQTEKDVAEARSRGTTAGRPLDAAVQKQVSDILTVQQQVQSIENNYDEGFLGPVRGTEAAFTVRRRVGSYVNSPLGEKETTFRQSLSDIRDQLLRARSGAQINETEYKRLSNLLPAATDEPQVFQAGMKRFKTELQTTLENKITLATTPRRDVPGAGVRPTPQQTPEGKMKIRNKKTGKEYFYPSGPVPDGFERM